MLNEYAVLIELKIVQQSSKLEARQFAEERDRSVVPPPVFQHQSRQRCQLFAKGQFQHGRRNLDHSPASMTTGNAEDADARWHCLLAFGVEVRNERRFFGLAP